MTYLYCFSRSGTDGGSSRVAGPGLGIAGTVIRTLALPTTRIHDTRRSLAWVSSMEQVPTRTAAHVTEHDRVCDAVLGAEDDVLPVRFGQAFESDTALTAEHQRQAATLRPLWEKIANAVEMSLTLVAKQRGAGQPAAVDAEVHSDEKGGLNKASSTGMGYAYLSTLAGPIRERRRLRELIEPFRVDLWKVAGTLIRGEAVHLHEASSATVLSHLVPREALSAYRGAVARVEIAHPLIRVLLLGPHAPFSFVSLDAGTHAASGDWPDTP